MVFKRRNDIVIEKTKNEERKKDKNGRIFTYDAKIFRNKKGLSRLYIVL